ncbi:MAG: ABC transporter permease [Clostridiales bacterium]|nr:ABC transporter permease [Clostridiales bacterium]
MSYRPEQFEPYMDMDDSGFVLVQDQERLHDKKLETKPVGFFRDALHRFSRNRGSVICAVIIVILALYAIIAPIVSPYGANSYDGYYSYSLPKNELFADLGIKFWDGCSNQTMNQQTYDYYSAIPGAIVEVYDVYTATVDAGREVTYYDVRLDSYAKVGYVTVLLTASEYEDALAYEEETGIQLFYPVVDTDQVENQAYKNDPNAWYLHNSKGVAQRDADGNLQNIYLTDEDSEDGYAYYISKMNGNQYQCRVLYSEWYYYQHGVYASFIFGADNFGYDICARLALGARLSLVLSVLVASVSLVIGIIIGSLEGYYGGTFDLLMERIKDILYEVPTVVFMSLFQIYFAQKVGPVVTLFFCFIFFNWIGTSSTVRAQFYRFKGQEYVLAARTLGAKDSRLIFRHILPNAAGFIITTSVLSIPSVIFTEANMTYLGIVNLQSSTLTSVGTMLNNGQSTLSTYPHCIFFPAAFISILLICFNIFGNGLRDAFNPSLRGADE